MLDFFQVLAACNTPGNSLVIYDCPPLWEALLSRGCVPYEWASEGRGVREVLKCTVGKVDLYVTRWRAVDAEERARRLEEAAAEIRARARRDNEQTARGAEESTNAR